MNARKNLSITVTPSNSNGVAVLNKAGAGNCNGGRFKYKSFCYGEGNRDTGREASVRACFNQVHDLNVYGHGCHHSSQGKCNCTVDSSHIWNWKRNFRQARDSLYESCHGFGHTTMERYEGNMYLAAICD